MAFKFVTFLALVAAANAGGLYSAAPVAYAAYAPATYVKSVEAPAEYSFQYGVKDALTGDFKDQHETRHGDVVKGQYSLLEADGTRRIVDYTADPVNGFNAVVSREGQAKVAAPVAVKTVAAVPVVKTVAAPIAYSQPAVLKTVAPAPVAYSTGYVAAPAPLYTKTAAAIPTVYKSYEQPALVRTYGAAPVAHYGPLAYSSVAGHYGGYVAAPYTTAYKSW